MKLFLLSIFLSIASAELYTAIEDLEALSVNQELLKKEYLNLIKVLEKNVKNLKKNVLEFNEEQAAMRIDSLGYVSNPLNAFLIIKRLSIDVSSVINNLATTAKDFESKCDEIRLPEEEFKGAADGFTRVQMFYDFKVNELAEGIIDGQKYGNGMSVDDLFTLGVYNLENNREQVSLSYLNLALEKNRQSNDFSELLILEKIYQNHENSNDSAKMYETIEKMLPLLPEGENKTHLREKLDEMPDSFLFELVSKYQLLVDTCRGTVYRSASELSRFKCRYVSKTPFFKLAPFKLEELNFDPYVVIFHDIVTDKEVETFKMQAKPSLQRSTLQGYLNKSESILQARVSKVSYNSDIKHEVFDRLTKRVSGMTGLNMEAAEAWQIQNYGIGGHYDQHYDFDDAETPFDDDKGNRIASLLFYLSDVQLGGATAFPLLRTRVLPKKGTVLFWYNLNTTAEIDHRTLHSGCPVAIGSKWVSNKWIRVFGQEFKKPCPVQLNKQLKNSHPWS